MTVIVTQAARRERAARALARQRGRCPSSDSLGRRRCALYREHVGPHLMASHLAEEWARQGRWPVGPEERPLAIPTKGAP